MIYVHILQIKHSISLISYVATFFYHLHSFQLFDEWTLPSTDIQKPPDIIVMSFGIKEIVIANRTEEGLHNYLSNLAFLKLVIMLLVAPVKN